MSIGKDNPLLRARNEKGPPIKVIIVACLGIILITAFIIWQINEYEAPPQPQKRDDWPSIEVVQGKIFFNTPTGINLYNLDYGLWYGLLLNGEVWYNACSSDGEMVWMETFSPGQSIKESGKFYIELYLVEWNPFRIWDYEKIELMEVDG